jgi:hypothetical protein
VGTSTANLDAPYQLGPARAAQILRHDPLSVRQPGLPIRPQPPERVAIAVACRSQEAALGVAPSAIQVDPPVHHTITSLAPRSAFAANTIPP